MESVRSSVSIASGLPRETVRSAPAIIFSGVITENLVCMPTPSAEENDRGGLEVAERRVLDRKAESAKRNPVSAREEIALVNTTNGSYSRRSTD
jgi:hypothetical protein